VPPVLAIPEESPEAIYEGDRRTWAKADKKAIFLCRGKILGDDGGLGAGKLIHLADRQTPTPNRPDKREA
jgi:hypothetical protein